MQKQLEILKGRFGNLRTDFKLGSILTDFVISKETGNRITYNEKLESLAKTIASELEVYRKIYGNDSVNLINNITNDVKQSFEDAVVEVPKLTTVKIPEVLAYYIDNDAIKTNPIVKLPRAVSLKLPKGQTLKEFLTYGNDELRSLVSIYLGGFSDVKLIELYEKYFNNISNDNKDIDKLLACRLNNRRGNLWEELVFVFVATTALLRKDSINELTHDIFGGPIQILRKNVISTLDKNIKLYEDFINEEVVISSSTDNGIVVIDRTLNRAFDKDIEIDVVYGASLFEKNKNKKVTIKDLKDKNLVYESAWKKEYGAKVVEIRNNVLRGFKTILSKHLIKFIDDSEETLKRFSISKDEVKKDAKRYVMSIRDVSEDNIDEICTKFINEFMYVNTGLRYFSSKIDKYRSPKYGFDMSMSINLAVNEVCTEILVKDLIIKA